MSLEWSSRTIDDVCSKVSSGGTPKSTNEDYYGGDIPWLNTKEINFNRIYDTEKHISELGFQNSAAKWVKKNSVIVAMYGATAAKVAMNMVDLTTNQACCNLTINEEIAKPKFVYYHLYNNFEKLMNLASGAAQQNLNSQTIKDFEIKIPSLEIQEKIINILSTIDDKIETNIRINKNLDDLLDLLFKEYFINKFDNADTNWKIKKIGELPLIITDYVANGSFASLKENVSILDYEDYAYFIRNTDLKAKCFEKFVNKHSYDFLKKSSLYGNEIIISNVGDVGSVFLCPFLDKPMTLGNNMILVKSNDDAIYLNFYLFLLFRSNFGQYLISTITAGSVQSKFNKTEFKSLELIMPDDEVIIKFNEFISPIFNYKNKISDEITNLTKLRDTLLPKLMSGEIDVSEINCDLE
ncbi:restriction endonuclease subunit S [Methanobrevibacter millerae]|uniref:Type I restriction enzyme, S subunit n=1 Tax=Methanobrevibacter millerae TaxID=230361 RepID=A0A1G5V5D4_9EURY|nr:restriction endonuclease subunit S [Methanobrevibacter millerae]SDA40205.1 type I restriction enzyme, S subunit [Methanobrevibacter millerae]